MLFIIDLLFVFFDLVTLCVIMLLLSLRKLEYLIETYRVLYFAWSNHIVLNGNAPQFSFGHLHMCLKRTQIQHENITGKGVKKLDGHKSDENNKY